MLKPVSLIEESRNTTGNFREQSSTITPAISFIGNSNSGKTALLEKIVKELKEMGYRVAVIKHSPHGFDIDQPGKDTWRLARAGSDVVAVSSPSRFAFIQQVEKEPSIETVTSMFSDHIDVILIEGYKQSEIPKIVVQRRERTGESFEYRGDLLYLITAEFSDSGEPQFRTSDIEKLVALIAEQIQKQQIHRESV